MHGSRELKQTFYESRTIKRLNLLFAHVVLNTDCTTKVPNILNY